MQTGIELLPMSVVIDKEALRQKYREERDKRLRPDGNAQYLRLTGAARRTTSTTPTRPVVEREPKTDHVTVAFIGGGFAGLVTGARLKEAGIDDVRIIEKGGDFGGTWYWNRYPGAQCDTASFVYMPLLEETGHMPTEKYAHAPEILEHCQRIGKQYGLYDNALFHTEVTDLEWDDDRSPLDHPHQPRRRVHRPVPRHGHRPAARPEAAGHPRHRVRSRATRSTPAGGTTTTPAATRPARRWTSWPTSGSPSSAPAPPSVQCVPHLARACQELYVFQRTPSSVDVRANHADRSRVVRRRSPRRAGSSAGSRTSPPTRPAGIADEDLVMDGWTDLARRIRAQIMAAAAGGRMTPEKMMEAFEDSDFEKMEEIRARVDSIVEDPETAQKLKAWYRQLCKRPCFHDEYLQAYNEPGAHLVDTDGKGVERITETGVVVAGRRVRGRLHHLRVGLRGRHRVHAPRRLRPHGPRRRAAVGVLGRGHAHEARHPRARLPEPVHRAADAGRQPDLERPPQPHRVGQDDRR